MELKQFSAVYTLVSCSHLLNQIVYVRHVSTGDNDTDNFSSDGEIENEERKMTFTSFVAWGKNNTFLYF